MPAPIPSAATPTAAIWSAADEAELDTPPSADVAGPTDEPSPAKPLTSPCTPCAMPRNVDAILYAANAAPSAPIAVATCCTGSGSVTKASAKA